MAGFLIKEGFMEKETTSKICPDKHTAYQPKDSNWRCPKCGSNNFSAIPEFDFADGDCGMLHAKDNCSCDDCGYSATGATVAKRLSALDQVKICPCCNGLGVVPE